MRGSLGPAKRAALNVLGREVSDMVSLSGCFFCFFCLMFALKKKGEFPRLREEMAEGEDERLILS